MIKPLTKKFLSPTAQFKSGKKDLPFTACDFWQWAYSDLQLNNIRGVFAEFLIAKALNIDLIVRSTWDDYDLETEDNIKIEIKSGGYLQSWQQRELSKVVFTGLCGQSWSVAEGRRSGKRKYRADIYIFAVQTAINHEEFDPLQIEQWEFYVLTKNEIEKRKTRSIALNQVKKLTDPVCFSEIEEHLRKKMK